MKVAVGVAVVGCVTDGTRQSVGMAITAGELEAAAPATFGAERGNTQSSARVAMGAHREQVRSLIESYLRAAVASDGEALTSLFAGRPLATDSGQPSMTPDDIVERHRALANYPNIFEPLRAALDRGDSLMTVRNYAEFRRQSSSAMPFLQPGDWVVNVNYATVSQGGYATLTGYLFSTVVVRWTNGLPKFFAVSGLSPRRF